MTLHMVEIRVRDWLISRTWYEMFLGKFAKLVDDRHEFLLIELGTTNIAIKTGECQPGSTTLVLNTADLDGDSTRLAEVGILPVEPEKISPEGYRRLIYRDPDGQRLILFQWHPATKVSA